MVVNFEEFANSIKKAEKMSIGVEEPRSKMVDNFDVNLTCLPRTQITLPNPTYRVILIGRRTLNYCATFGAEKYGNTKSNKR